MAPYDLLNDPIDKVNYFCLSRLQSKYDLMILEKNLCDPISAGVVAEFGFKGPRQAVIDQLGELLQYRLETPYQDRDRGNLEEEGDRFSLFLEQQRNSPKQTELRRITKEWFELFPRPGNNYLRLEELSTQRNTLGSQLEAERTSQHESRLCLCFKN